MVNPSPIFLILGQKGHFFQKMAAPSKKCYSPKYVYWYQCYSVWKMVGAKSSVHGRPAQCFRHSIDSHCLCMWVKKQPTFYNLMPARILDRQIHFKSLHTPRCYLWGAMYRAATVNAYHRHLSWPALACHIQVPVVCRFQVLLRLAGLLP